MERCSGGGGVKGGKSLRWKEGTAVEILHENITLFLIKNLYSKAKHYILAYTYHTLVANAKRCGFKRFFL